MHWKVMSRDHHSLSESSGLLEDPAGSRNRKSSLLPTSKPRPSAFFLIGFSAVFVWLSFSLFSWQGKVPSSTIVDQQTGRKSFDEKYLAWQSDLYSRSQQFVEPPILGSSRTADDERELVYFNHSRAFEMLKATEPSLVNDFYFYQQGWDAQINQAYCAVASSMAVMNSLRGKLDLPQDPAYVPYSWATQPSLIQNECVRDNLYDVDKMEHLFWGLGLEMAAILLNCNLQGLGFEAAAYPVDPNAAAVHEIRSTFKSALKDENTRLLINYDRGGITQGPMGHGHFSPIGAYNAEQDAFLVLDVAKYKYPPVWVPTSKLMGGIATLDNCAFFNYPDKPMDISYPNAQIATLLGCQPMYRGYILITRNDTIRSRVQYGTHLLEHSMAHFNYKL